MRHWWSTAFLSTLLSVLAIGCGDAYDAEDGGGNGDDGEKTVISQQGSDTMVPLASKWSEEFMKSHPNISIQVLGGGSGTGIKALLDGSTNIANASRAMADEEKEKFSQTFGRDVIEIPVAKDGITIYVSSSNPIESLSIAQLRDIYSGTITSWKQVGGPDQNIVLYGRENSSGTFDFFKEHVLNKGDFAPNTQTLQGTAAVVSAVGKDANGIGYGGAAYTVEGIKTVKVSADGGEAFDASEANVFSGKYPLSRDLYIYLAEEPSGPIKEYVDWILGEEGQSLVTEVGYFPIKAGNPPPAERAIDSGTATTGASTDTGDVE